MSTQHLITAYLAMQERLREQRKIIKELRCEEKKIEQMLCDCINQNDENDGIRIDDTRVIKVINKEKKIMCKKKEWVDRMVQLYSEMYDMTPEDFIDAILRSKIDMTVKEQKLKIVKL